MEGVDLGKKKGGRVEGWFRFWVVEDGRVGGNSRRGREREIMGEGKGLSGSFSGEFSPKKMVEEDGKTEREGEEYGAVAIVVAGTAATAAGLGGGGIWGRRREKERGSVWGGLIWGRRRDFRRESRRKVWWSENEVEEKES
ncbi:uncharacterized protein G2W53_033711 [Senna tora]|uniref:Uncharacterized protein n=1 Tax=Senna tora TaxID=362788 RepID=A0A834W785_9FABA|nr:uncharacterized protein G2W53_033711 [Senna tora]